jgi:uncharacterized protein (TIGR03435 family)
MTKRAAIACLFASWILSGQGTDRLLRFEAASVRASVPTRQEPGVRLGCKGGPGTDNPDEITCEHVYMRSLVMLAFHLLPHEYRDAPLDFTAPAITGGYSISAKVPRGATLAQIRTMWQNLLKERFHLSYHFERKDSIVYDLFVAPGGPRFKEAVPRADDVEQLVRADNGCPVIHPRPGTSEGVLLGRVECYSFSAVTMQDLARFTAVRERVPVNDLTDLKGKYDIAIRFAQGPNDTAAPPAPFLLDALPLQLGLRVERRNGTSRVFVMDHIDNLPSEN